MLEWKDDAFSYEKAADLADCASAAYYGKLSMRKFARTAKLDKYKMFDKDGAQAFVAVKGDITVVAFRGTEPKQASDILADLNAFPKKSRLDGWVHAGFRGEVDKIWNEVEAYVKSECTSRVYFTGHSLGGAMSTVASSRWHEPARCYNYGSPRVGTRSFRSAYNTNNELHRFVNNNDIVCRVPPALLMYVHVGKLHYINHYGNTRSMTWWQRIKDQWRGRIRAWQKKQPFDGVFDHSMGLYRDKLRAIADSTKNPK